MHLDREILMRIEELHQQGELIARSGLLAEQPLSVTLDQIAQGHARKGALSHPADVEAMVGDFPALGMVVPIPQWLSQDRFQTSSAPENALEDRLETQGGQT